MYEECLVFISSRALLGKSLLGRQQAYMSYIKTVRINNLK